MTVHDVGADVVALARGAVVGDAVEAQVEVVAAAVVGQPVAPAAADVGVAAQGVRVLRVRDALEVVVARPAVDPVVAGTAHEVVRAGPAVHVVVPTTRLDRVVVARPGVDRAVSVPVVERVVAVAQVRHQRRGHRAVDVAGAASAALAGGSRDRRVGVEDRQAGRRHGVAEQLVGVHGHDRPVGLAGRGVVGEDGPVVGDLARRGARRWDEHGGRERGDGDGDPEGASRAGSEHRATVGAALNASSTEPQRRDSHNGVQPGVLLDMRLYDYAASGNCYKVRLALAQLELPYERIPVDIFAGDTLTDEFGRLNPARTTPVLVRDGEEPLPESAAILLRVAEGTALLPDDPGQRAQVNRWLVFEQTDVIPAVARAPLPPSDRPPPAGRRGRAGAARGWGGDSRTARRGALDPRLHRERRLLGRRHRALRLPALGRARPVTSFRRRCAPGPSGCRLSRAS